MTKQPDFLDELIAEETTQDPDFPQLYEAELQRRELLHQLAVARKNSDLSQQALADQLDVSQPAIQQLESRADAKLSTIQRYAAAIGKELHIELKDAA